MDRSNKQPCEIEKVFRFIGIIQEDDGAGRIGNNEIVVEGNSRILEITRISC